MPSVQDITTELADNWPAFVYIVMTLVFSFFFFRQRRKETQLLKRAGERIEETINARLDHLEDLIQGLTAARNEGNCHDQKAGKATAGF